MRNKLVRITTVPSSLDKLLDGQLKFMNMHFEVIAISSDANYLNLIGKKEGVRTYSVNLTRRITPLIDLVSLCKLILFFLKEKPLIVHTHTPKAGIIGMLASYLTGIPHRLHTVAGLPLLESKGFKRIVLNFVEKLTYYSASKVYSNSFALREIIIESKFCNAKKIKVIAHGSSNGIDTDFFNPSLFNTTANYLKNKLGIYKNDFVFIFIGRLVSAKGLNELISAFDELSDDFKNIKLLLVGDYENDLDPLDNATITKIKNSKQIITSGFQNDVRPYLSVSDVLILPSYREGFPNVVLQSLSMGLPGIVTNINGCNELIKHNYNGLLVPSKSKEELKESMHVLLKDSKLLSYLSLNARISIIDKFDRNKFWKSILTEYKNVLQTFF